MISERMLYRKAMMVARSEAVFIATSPCRKPRFNFARSLKRSIRRLVRWFHKGIPWNDEWTCIGPIGLGPSSYGYPIWWHHPSGRLLAGYPRYPFHVYREGMS